jgi:co-chaperonin GroES (HSP10)
MSKKAKRQIFLPSRTQAQAQEDSEFASESLNRIGLKGRARQHDTDAEIERRIQEADEQARLKPIGVQALEKIMQPMFWHVLIEPMRAKQKVGSIYVANETQRVEEIQTTIGRLVAMGPTAFTGKTNSGNELAKGIDRDTLIGSWVMYQKHTGQEIKLRSGHRLILMNDSELLAFVNDPEDFRHWL